MELTEFRVILESWNTAKTGSQGEMAKGEFQMMFGLIILVIVAFYMFNSTNSGGSCCMNHQSQVHTSIDILNDRYARGEINREEYLERKQALSGQKQTISIKKG